MAIKTFKYFDAGVGFKDQAADNITTNGVIYRNGTKLKAYIENAARELVTTSQSQVLTNKTIDADLNTISNIEVADFKSGVIDTDLNAVSGANDTIPSAKAVKDYVDQQILTEDAANEISYDNTTSGLAATNVQAAIDEIEARVDTVETNSGNNATAISNHLSDASDAHDASAISNVPSGNLAATDVQAALNELQGDIDTANTNIGTANTNLTNHLNDASDAHDASAISNIPAGNLAATDLQGAVNELQSDVDLRTLTTNGSIITPTRLDVKQDTKANLTTYALTATNGQIVFATDTKEYFAIKDTLLSDLGGGGGIASVDILSAETADKAAIGDFTQTGLEILETPIVLHGLKSFRLQHATSIKSFKKVIAVDRKFRGKNNTISLDVASTATNANLNIIFRDETNSVNLGVSQAIATGSVAITATTANTSNQLTGMTNTVLNSLKVGMVITGSAIPVGTTITAISNTAATMSQNATGVATGIRISDLVAKKSFSVDIPANCQSFSWAISTVVEAATESYIDDVVVQLTSAALSSTSITQQTSETQSSSLIQTATIGSANITGVLTTSVGTTIYSYNSGTGVYTALRSGQVDVQASFRTAVANIVIPTITKNATVLASSTSTPTAGYWETTSASFDVVAGDTFFVSNSPSSNTDAQKITVTAIAYVNETKTIPLTSAQLVQQSDSVLRLNTALGYGSTGTRILRFSTIEQSLGASVNYIASSINGDSFTILENGLYEVSFTWSATAASDLYITKNQSNLAAVPTLNEIIVQATTQPTSGFADTAATSIYLSSGDIIRCSTDGGSVGGRPARFAISKQGSLKQLNISSDSKIQIPTHQLRFEGASSRGATDTAIVKFDTQAITQGDAWDVVNTAANGTVVTMKKAGKLQVSTSIATANTAIDIRISKNQTTLTSVPPIAEIVASGSQITANEQVCVTGFTDVVVGDKIRISTEPQNANGTTNFFTLSLTENSIPANFSNVLPQWSQSDSSARLNTANGYGSTNTAIRRFTNNPDNLGSSITYSDSATFGASFTINEDGEYQISYSDSFTAGNTFAITKNQTTLTTAVVSLPASEVLALATTSAANTHGNVACEVKLVKGDIIRANGSAQPTGSTNLSQFTISKVGKPNLTAVDVTPFVNMKTTDVEAIEALTATSTFGSTNTGVPVLNITRNTNLGVIQVVSNSVDGTSFKVLKDCELKVSVSSIASSTSPSVYITRNSTILTAASTNGVLSYGTTTSSAYGNNTVSVKGSVGDIIRVHRASTNLSSIESLTLTATADNNAIATPTQQVSSDTMSFAFKATAITDTDAIGTFNTYTYAANTNTATISASAPTQTVADMNVNGVRVFARAYNAASTTASPARVDIKIGKGLKGRQVSTYASIAKVSALSYDRHPLNALMSNQTGTDVTYSETTGILSVNAAVDLSGLSTSRSVGYSDSINAGDAYFVFNASTTPSITALPNLAPRIATLSDVKASGAAGGGATAGTQTRTLNTLVDPTGIVTSLASNQITLSAGTYYIRASAPAGFVSSHKIRFRNITDSSTALIGSSEFVSPANAGFFTTRSTLSGEITITSSKVFELQHYVSTTRASDGLGTISSNGESEVYSIVEITKVK